MGVSGGLVCVEVAWVIVGRWGGVGIVMVKVLNGAAPSVGTGRTAASTRAAASRLVILEQRYVTTVKAKAMAPTATFESVQAEIRKADGKAQVKDVTWASPCKVCRANGLKQAACPACW